MGRRGSWTPALAREAVELGLEGVGPADIGRRLGIAANKISALFTRLRAAEALAPPRRRAATAPRPGSPWADEAVCARVFELVAGGVSMKAIAAELRVTKGAVAGFLSRARSAGEGRAFIEELRALLAEEAAGGPDPPTLEQRLPPIPVGCRWIFGHPRDGTGLWSYCDAPLVAYRPYCAAHMALCYDRRPSRGA